ncbi:MAG TPA: DUF6788 family protein [Bryobacteraceae bacterium]|nr:DUF6788 family protein [Bryobacteraceae bacterium]
MTAGLVSTEVLRRRRDEVIATIGGVGDMRPGSLVERFRKCGKPTCRCARMESGGHGPCFSLTQSVGGKTRTRILPQGMVVDRARTQIAEYRRFRALVRELVAISEQIADAELETVAAGQSQATQK